MVKENGCVHSVSSDVVGVTAVGDMTVSVGKSVGNTTATAVNDTTKWVREQSESFGTELGTTHTMLPDQSVSEIATEHNVKVHSTRTPAGPGTRREGSLNH